MVCLGQFFMFIFLSSNSNTLHTDIYSFCKNNFHFTPVNTKGHHQNPHRCKGDSCPFGLGDFIYIIFHPTFPNHFLFSGTLEGGLPLVLLNKAMRGAIGWLYIWKNTILIVTIVLSIIIYRPFCRYICPLGAFYSVFNKVSIYRYRVDMEKCVHCGKCAKACQMVVNPVENPNSPECIRCGRCKQACPVHAIASGCKR